VSRAKKPPLASQGLMGSRHPHYYDTNMTKSVNINNLSRLSDRSFNPPIRVSLDEVNSKLRDVAIQINSLQTRVNTRETMLLRKLCSDITMNNSDASVMLSDSFKVNNLRGSSVTRFLSP
jgi:hypothetical protein